MKEIVVLLLYSTISPTLAAPGTKIFGPMVNISEWLEKIWLKGTKELEINLLPDTTSSDWPKKRKPGVNAAVTRRFLKDLIAIRRQQILNNEKFFGNENEDSALAEGYNLEDIRDRILEAVGLNSRRHVLSVDVENEGVLLKRQHDSKMREIKEFLDNSYESTDYIYNEVQRIKKDRVIRDPLRKMVDYLSQPYMDDLVNSVFKCFQEKRKVDRPPKNVWKHRVPNTLVINTFEDPYNHGSI